MSRTSAVRAGLTVALLLAWASLGQGVPRSDLVRPIQLVEAGDHDLPIGPVGQKMPIAAFLHVVHAVDENVVWAGGDAGTVLRTTDGGLNWEERNVPTVADLWGLYAIDDVTCLVGTAGSGAIWRTTDAGQNWSFVRSVGSFINGIHFFDSENGWLVADPTGGVFNIWETADGGQTWIRSLTAPPALGTYGLNGSFEWLGDICIFGTAGAFAWRSTDGGSTWAQVVTGHDSVLDIELNDDGLGLATGLGSMTSALRRTTDSGQTWEDAHNFPAFQASLACDWIRGTGEVWVGAYNEAPFAYGYLRSTNGGLDWSTLYPLPEYESLSLDINFVSSSAGWDVGGDDNSLAVIRRWTGTAWITQYAPGQTSVEPGAAPLNRLVLRSIHPNPFTPSTMVSFELREAGPVSLRIYDSSGRLVRTLADGRVTAGPHSVAWNGRDDRGTRVASGVYLTRLDFRGETLTRPVVLVK